MTKKRPQSPTHGPTIWLVDYEELVQTAAAGSGWHVIGITEAKELRTKTQVEHERSRVAQAHPQVLVIHLRSSFGTDCKSQKLAIKPYEHVLDLGAHLLDRKVYVAFEGCYGSELLRHAVFNRISKDHALRATLHRWCNLEVKSFLDGRPTAKAVYVVSNFGVQGDQECRCGVKASKHLLDGNRSTCHHLTAEEEAINQSGWALFVFRNGEMSYPRGR